MRVACWLRRYAPPREEHATPFAHLGFGGGIHQCMGQQFGFCQVKTILSWLNRHYDMELASAFPEPDYTAMVVGPNFTTGRVVGGYDDGYYGRNIDLGTGELDDGGRMLSAEAFGATLLAAADVDPGEYIMDADPITGILA